MEDPFSRYMPEPNTGCWFWDGPVDKNGYGIVNRTGLTGQFAHRRFYEEFKGPIPEKMTVDHICFQPLCVNPDHLQLLTLSENCRRQRSAMKTHCASGHEFTPENTYRRPDGTRDCRACIRERVAKYRKKAA